jgi:hypothetical protein
LIAPTCEATVGGAAEDPRGVDEDATEHEQPEAQRVEAGEGDVTSADLQRHHVVGERCRHRHHEEEHHRGGVHREHLVVLVGRQDRAVGLGELSADQERLEATDEEEDHGDDAVHDPDLLVVDGERPRLPAGGVHRTAEVPVGRRWCDDGRAGAGQRRGVGRSFDDGHGLSGSHHLRSSR